MLGPGESGTGRLEEAVAAYRDALEELTHERVPLDWAATQNNLGNALTTLGERESGTARLEEAVAAYRDALDREDTSCPSDEREGASGPHFRVIAEEERTYGRLIELRDLFHAITGELDSPTASLPNISNIVARPSRFRRSKP
jgi:tetratricopeptide (TPR) repeat protein